MTALEILRSARALLADPEHWLHAATGAESVWNAHGTDGYGRNPWDADAVRWDVYGAFVAARGSDKALDLACCYLGQAIGIGGDTSPSSPGPSAEQMGRIFDWNDAAERTHEELLAALDAAIVLAEKEGSAEG